MDAGFSSCWYWNGGELKCACDLTAPESSARLRVGVRQRHGERVELAVLPLAERLLGGHLQRDRLDRHLDRRQRDLVLLGEVL